MTEQQTADIQGRAIRHQTHGRHPNQKRRRNRIHRHTKHHRHIQPHQRNQHHPEATLTRWLFSFLDLISELAHLENPHANSTPSNNTQ